MSTATTNSTEQKYAPIPEGEYLVRMQRINEKTTKAGDPALSVSFQVMQKIGDTEDESKTKNRLLFDYLVLEHSNPKVTQITRERVDKYLKAVGESNGIDGIGGDFSKLSNYLETPLIAKVAVKDDGKGYGPSNKITSFKRR
jgi:hypothetical protein